jgi:rare lipoprotein A (peptidoglycan hydrolase)
MQNKHFITWVAGAALIAGATAQLCGHSPQETAQASLPENVATQQAAIQRFAVSEPKKYSPQPDRSGQPREGVASFYANWFAGRQMANGETMDPHGDNAASRTLPLGTIAKVTNLSTGKSAVVHIKDRGPYAKERLVDLSPATARKIGISEREGVARVKITPIIVPMPDGHVLRGVAMHDPEVAQLQEIAQYR